jgi:uncharacterized membrane protein
MKNASIFPVKRLTLDRIARENQLSLPAIDLALDLTGCRPSAADWRRFGARLMHGTGVAALGAGIIFFVAANWQDYGIVGRFVLLQVAFLAAIGVAWWREPPHLVGSAALVLAILLTGGLLALFGQSYQTGADVFELFFAWALLALPLAVAAQSGAAWATWWVVLNVGMALYCGWLGPQHFLWSWIDRGGIGRPLLLLVPCAVNVGGAALFEHLATTRHAAHAPRWLMRLLLALGFIYGTVASIVVVTGATWGRSETISMPQNAFVLGFFALVSAAVAWAALRAKKDVFPMAVVTGSWIAITTAVLVTTVKFRDIGSLFLVAAWLIGTSTAAGFLLMRWVREWRFDDEPEDAPEARA